MYLKKGYIQCTETLFLIGSYPLGNYPPWWDHHLVISYGVPIDSLSDHMSPREKVCDFKKQFKINLFCYSKLFTVTDAAVRIKRPKNCIFIYRKKRHN